MAERTTSHLIWYPGHERILEAITRAENCYLYDREGNRYVDLESGVWCTSIGHANPRVLRLMTEQASRIGHTGFCYSNPAVEEAAQQVLALLGMQGGRCVFLCAGSEAVEYGVRVAAMLLDRPLMMTMADSYFGAYGSAKSKRPEEWFAFDWFPCAECPHSAECGPQCELWQSIPFDQIGGFLFEPGSSSGLVRFPPEKLIRKIAERVQGSGGLLLVNEVTTGVGRTGAWFGYQHYGIAPDIVALGKGIGNGYPVSVTAVAPGVADRLGDRPVNYSQSHQNDPLGAVIAQAVIQFIQEENLIERSRQIGARLIAGLEEIGGRSRRVRAVRARGLMVAVELVDDPEQRFTSRTHRELVRRGFIVGRRPGVSVLRLDPSLTIGPEEIEGFLETFEAVLAEDSGDSLS